MPPIESEAAFNAAHRPPRQGLENGSPIRYQTQGGSAAGPKLSVRAGRLGGVATDPGCGWHGVTGGVAGYGQFLVDDPDRLAKVGAAGGPGLWWRFSAFFAGHRGLNEKGACAQAEQVTERRDRG